MTSLRIFLEIRISGAEWLGFLMFGPAFLFLLLGIIFAANKKKKPGKIFLILGGVCLLVALGMCGMIV